MILDAREILQHSFPLSFLCPGFPSCPCGHSTPAPCRQTGAPAQEPAGSMTRCGSGQTPHLPTAVPRCSHPPGWSFLGRHRECAQPPSLASQAAVSRPAVGGEPSSGHLMLTRLEGSKATQSVWSPRAERAGLQRGGQGIRECKTGSRRDQETEHVLWGQQAAPCGWSRCTRGLCEAGTGAPRMGKAYCSQTLGIWYFSLGSREIP